MPSKKAKPNMPLVMAGGNTVDIFRSKRIANIFFFFISAAKASLLPFLTIYLRLLGLSPIQTGIILGTQAMVMAIFVPFWLKVGYLCNKKKILMLCSIGMLIMSNLALTGVPPKDSNELLIWCPPGQSTNVNSSATQYADVSKVTSATTNATSLPTTPSAPTTPTSPTNSTAVTPTSAGTTATPVTTPHPTSPATPATSATATPTPTTNITEGEKETTASKPSSSTKSKKTANIEPASEAESKTTNPEEETTEEQPGQETTEGGRRTSRHRHRKSTKSPKHTTTEHHREKRSLSLRSIGDKISHFQTQVYSINNRTFILVLIILIVGEMFSCAAEKFADDAWFTLLDSVDDVEKYGSHKYWSSIAYIFYAVIVAMVVDTRECFLSLRIHHFMIHFYVFAALLVCAWLTGLFYPFYPRDKPSKHHMRRSGFRILCSDMRSFLFVFTILLLGCANAGITAFLFWRVQDVGGTEIQMGVVVMIRSVAELMVLIFSKVIIHRFGIAFCSVIGLLAMVARLIYFSFLWSPWAVVGVEILYGLSNTLLWQAVCAHPDFSLNIVTRRTTQNIFYILYYGVGASFGCIIAGYGYAYKTLPVVYQSTAIVVGIWMVIFAIAQKCLPRAPQVKYARLLADDDEESESDEDDWLEMALKSH